MKSVFLLTALFATIVALAGCGHHDLKAPCSAAEGTLPLGYAEAPAIDSCGPMRPVNTPFDVMSLDPHPAKAAS